MVGRKVFKTRICQLYQKGRCHRQPCSFAHGSADIRRPRPLYGKRDHEGRDLRETLERRRSPVHRYSPVKDHRGRHSSHGGYTPGALSGKNDLEHQKKHIDGEGDSYRSPNDNRQGTSESRDFSDEQLTELQTKIDMLHGHKSQLELYIKECTEEAAGLTSKIEDLEGQLDKEKEETKRMTSKIKKFIKAYTRNSRLQDELKRSYAQLQKQVETLSSDISGPGTNAEDMSNNISSDKGSPVHITTRGYDDQHKTLSSRKRVRMPQEPNKASIQDNGMLGDKTKTIQIRPSKVSEVDVHHAQDDKSKKMKLDDRNNGRKPLVRDEHNRRGNNLPKESKVSESGLALPSTSMAAHPVDEVEIVEADGNNEVVEDDTALCEKEVAGKGPPLPPLHFLPPPPPIRPNAFTQYNSYDESVDIEGIDEETTDVDID